jgi:ribosomal protein S11
LANSEGQVISWSSAGKMGFRGSKKNTPYAAQTAAGDCAKGNDYCELLNGKGSGSGLL